MAGYCQMKYTFVYVCNPPVILLIPLPWLPGLDTDNDFDPEKSRASAIEKIT